MKTTTVYDNHADEGPKSRWGFSCLIEAKEKILFDTGDSGENLIYNLRQLDIQPENLAAVVISHNRRGSHRRTVRIFKTKQQR